ncbi:OmpA family protein [Solitalea canadensis]|uniref:Outer membrane protein/peptidoglycan-associated (Lipo)protein n=1 Tax=Solitalea canadensis (strain ATCC 29591 / DSM 3403 / JCM 21819 / LMG 8368 / NBRC 15130 / NCIMB 12057 / USAM 9D) TaxID=929556 RepID=H8KPV6_SOLCM|nr:OmpA family protein [Solitalea canadensis]AFD06065.1 outer membrane protein/peptidoglycan-associated (lipo)protein [Solitalea canadensis DSM 3403]
MKISSKYLCVILLCIGNTSVFGQSTFGRLKQKATGIAEKVIDKKTDELLEDKSGKKDNTRENPTEKVKKERVKKQNTVYDFQSGSTVLLKEDFLPDVTGQFPMQWYTRSKGEVVEFNDVPGKWLQLYSGTFLSPTVLLKENYTIEFDVIIDFPPNGNYPLPALKIGLYDRGNKGYILSNDYRVKNNVNIILSPYRNELRVKLKSIENNSNKIATENYILPDFTAKLGKPVHIAMDIQKERIRVWIDQEKIFDLPQTVPVSNLLNQLRLELESSNYKNSELGYYISNLCFADGSPDTRSKLLTEGKLESNSILFATNSAKIESDNQGVIKEVAAALKQDNAIRIKVIGHTDSDGTPKQNMALSQKRAESVKRELIEKYGIGENRIETLGKGDTEPVEKNMDPNEKAKNRRVEFVRL